MADRSENCLVSCRAKTRTGFLSLVQKLPASSKYYRPYDDWVTAQICQKDNYAVRFMCNSAVSANAVNARGTTIAKEDSPATLNSPLDLASALA
jgi:hypothetical protein